MVERGIPFSKRLTRLSGSPRFDASSWSVRFYVGLTGNVRQRLGDHNAGRCPHTTRYRPWQLHVSIEFGDEERAIRFERCLKSGSGRTFGRTGGTLMSPGDGTADVPESR